MFYSIIFYWFDEINKKTMTYEKPFFEKEETERFEKMIDTHISKGYQQISIPTGIISKDTERFGAYLNFYYPSGTFNTSARFRNYRIAKNGKKCIKRENW